MVVSTTANPALNPRSRIIPKPVLPIAIALNSRVALQPSPADEPQTPARAGGGPGILVERLNTVYNQIIYGDGITININDRQVPHEKMDN